MYPLQKDLQLIGTFSEIQKTAIINLLSKVGGADGELSDAESLMIAKCNQILKIDLNDKESDTLINRMFAYSLDELIEILKPLTRGQHEFIVRSVYDVHNADKMAIEKTDMLIKICKGFSIESEQLTNILTQSEKKSSSYTDTSEYRKQEASGKILFDYLEQNEKKIKASNNSGCLGLIFTLIVTSISLLLLLR